MNPNTKAVCIFIKQYKKKKKGESALRMKDFQFQKLSSSFIF